MFRHPIDQWPRPPLDAYQCGGGGRGDDARQEHDARLADAGNRLSGGGNAMRYAILADIHANREALNACLDAIARVGVDRLVFLGDMVGYGADPAAVTDRVREEVAKGAIAVQGNHDAAIKGGGEDMNSTARRAIDWTREQLDLSARRFLEDLPLTSAQGDVLFVHACARSPDNWLYVTSTREARLSLDATQARITMVGHVHVPAIYHAPDRAPVESFDPHMGVAVPLMRRRRWLAVLGAVGQPRDGNPAACWGLLDLTANSFTFQRVAYDAAAAARKVRAAGLPESLATRLEKGF
jgi:diadenosine tetraphosphatase ApaH/serine/threonine PP2A family protein phosphatase